MARVLVSRVALAGHLWTLSPALRNALDPIAVAERPWSTTVADPRLGPIRLSGLLDRVAGARGIVVIVHGLGGRPSRHYCVRAAAAAASRGLSSLRVALRGADRLGEDFHHGGLTADLHAAIASPEVQAHETVHVLGFSLGGHVSLRLASEPGDARLRSVAAICSPLDLGVSSRVFDTEIARPYREWVMAGMRNVYVEVARRREVPTPWSRVRSVRVMREWDTLTVVPRYGFRDVDDYYRQASVAPLLARLRVPSLLVAAEGDPMVPARSLRPFLDGASSLLDVRWTVRGGHVAFPRDLDLGLGPDRGLEAQVLAWLARH